MTTESARERADILESLQTHRFFLRSTCDGLTDEQAAQRTTVSELCLGGLMKHVAAVEAGWAAFMVGGAEAMKVDREAYADQFRMVPGETLTGLLDAYAAVAAHTDGLVGELDLDADFPLPKAPWFPPDGRRTVRRTLLHIVAETAQHSGHADIIREALDGKKTMG